MKGLKLKPSAPKPEKPPPFWLVTDPEHIGEVFNVKHGKSAMVMHGEKFSPQFAILFVDFSPDGSLLCTASEDRTARIFDIASGKQLKIFEHPDWVRTARFNPEGNWLCTACTDGFVRIWDVLEDTGKLASVTKPMKQIESGRIALSACFAPDSRTFATTSWDKTVRIYDVRDWSEMLKIQYGEDPRQVCYSADSKRFATGCSDCFARIHETPEPLPEDYVYEEVKMRQLDLSQMKIRELKDRLTKREMSDKGRKKELIERLTAVGGDKTPEDPPPDPTRSLQEFFHPDKLFDVQFNQEGTWLITACRDKVARVLDIETGQVLAFCKHPNWIYSAQLLKDTSVLCTTCDDGYVRVWDPRAEKEIIRLPIGGPATSAHFSPDGLKICTGSKVSCAQIFGSLI